MGRGNGSKKKQHEEVETPRGGPAEPHEGKPAAPVDPASLEALLDQAAARTATASGAFLLVVSGQNVGRMYAVSEWEQRIGRSQQADIRVDEQAVSQWHARVTFDGRTHRIADLGSTNGTSVNGVFIADEIDLRPGDVVGIGDVTVVYLRGQAEGTERTRSVRPERAPAQAPALAPAPAAALAMRDVGSVLAARPDTAAAAWSERGVDLAVRVADAWFFVASNARLLALLAGAAGALGLVTLLAVPPRAIAVVEVKLKPEPSANPVRDPKDPLRAQIAFFDGASNTFVAPPLVRKTLAALGQPATDGDVLAVVNRLKLGSVALNAYRAEYQDRDPEDALAFLSRHIDVYLDHEIAKNVGRLKAQVDFLSRQVLDSEKQLSQTEARLQSFKEQQLLGLPEFAGEQLSSRFQLALRRDELRSQLSRLQGELSLARSQVAGEDALVEDKVALARPYQQEIAAVRQRLALERARGLGETHPDVQALLLQVASLEGVASETVAATSTDLERRANRDQRQLGARAQELKVAVRSTRQELSLVNAQVAALDRLAARLPGVESMYAELLRRHEATKELHEKLFAQQTASQLQLDLERASAAARYEIVLPPHAIPASWPKATVTRAGVGVFIGLLLGVALCLGRAFLERVKGALEKAAALRRMAAS